MHRKKGFTLIELMVVIAIIVLLMAILMPAPSQVRESLGWRTLELHDGQLFPGGRFRVVQRPERGRGRQQQDLSNVAVRSITDSERDWTREGMDTLSLWFRGNPASVGSFAEGPVGTYTMTASGTDITGGRRVPLCL